MEEIEILLNKDVGKNFINQVMNKKFLFSFIISYTSTSEIPGITFAGANKDFIKFTPPADAEFLHYGFCKTIDSIPMTPDGKPTPALLTKAALESASIPHVIINAGSMISPNLPYFFTGLDSGKNISEENAMNPQSVVHAVDYGRIIGRMLASVTDCLIIGESIPGGTTTALAVMRGLNYDAKVSSSIPNNPIDLKNDVVNKALKRLSSKDPYEIVSKVGDPFIATAAGMLSSASEIVPTILAGGTQMAAVLAFANFVGYRKEKTALATTSYIVNDKSANFLELVEKISPVPVLTINPNLEKSKFSGLRAFSEGFAKEGVGAGGSIIASMLKTGLGTDQLLEKIELEYQKIFTSQ